MKNRRYDLWWVLLIWTLMCCLPMGATTVTGQAKLQGVPFNGYLDVALVYPATTGAYLAMPGNGAGGHQTVTNGYFEAMNLEGNDTLLPRGTYYTFTYSDIYGQPITRLNYSISGATFDIGAAVPTPVTTNNINFLDLLGIRNFSANNVQIGNQIQIRGTGAIFGVNGLSNAKTVDDIQFATGYTTGSTTCGAQEAINALPATGGTVVLPIGTCNITTTIVINKPVHLMGHGAGGPSNAASTTFANSTTLVSNGAASIEVTIPSPTTSLSGVVISDFAIQNPLDGIYVVGSSTAQVQNLTVARMTIINPVNYGVHLQDGSVGTTIDQVICVGGQFGFLFNDSAGGGSISNTLITNSEANMASASGLGMISPGVLDVTVIGSYFMSNANDGVFVGTAASASSFRAYASTFGNNGNAGVELQAGAGHLVDGSSFPAVSRQQYGVYANYAGSATINQVLVQNSSLFGNLTDDIYLGSSITSAVVYPEVLAFTDSSVHNVFGSGVKFVATGTTPTTNVVSRTCNSNGCYRQEADGTLEMWGVVSGCGAGPSCTTSVTFPASFTTTSNLSVVATCASSSSNCTATIASVSTSSASVGVAAVIYVGGTGSNISGESIHWHATGN